MPNTNPTYDFLKGEVLLIDKPLEWTSFDVVNKLRYGIKKTLQIKKIKVGHAGTLDPLATGLLIICTGKFTKRIEEFQCESKVYEGIIELGATRPSYDRETEIDATFDYSKITKEQIYNTAKQLTGALDQIPPIFSAKKINGKKAYEVARKGGTIEMRINKINVSQFKITAINLPEIKFEIHCSKGTYIRSLAYDFGKILNNGAFLQQLRRIKSGNFDVSDALKIEDFQNILDKIKPLA